MTEVDIQIDRLVGPTHHFSGLGLGNRASIDHAGQVSNPAAAALEGLDKMRLIANLGLPQWILPPQPRPAFEFLRSCGFRGSEHDVLRAALESSPQLLAAACSSSAMWTANAASVTAAADSGDHRVKVSVANLSLSIHRSLEPATTYFELARLLAATGLASLVDLYPAVSGGFSSRDEGAANHMRLSSSTKPNTSVQSAPVHTAAVNLFVYGDGDPRPTRFLARQSRLACEVIARRHLLAAERTFYLKQNPVAIDAGAFHNDVVALSHEDLFIQHELAYDDANSTLDSVSNAYKNVFGIPLRHITVSEKELPLDVAVATYLFNSQVVTTPQSRRVFVCPTQVREHPTTLSLVQSWRDQHRLFDELCFVSLSQSMAGGGGPACLRLRLPVAATLLSKQIYRCQWSEDTDQRIRKVIAELYPTRLTLADMVDPQVSATANEATCRLTEILLPLSP